MTKSTSRAALPFFEKYEFVIPLGLFLLFLVITLPGISWGAPNAWNPDEIVVRSIKALHGEWVFDEINFDYPSLPQWVMFWLGKALLYFGKTDTEIWIASRVLSAALAGLTIVLTYFITRRMGHPAYLAGLSGLLLLSVSEMTHNGRFAHNDTFVTFFACLTLYFLVRYKNSNQKGWLYASFITIGMAASSKYNGISLALAPAILYLFSQRHSLLKNLLQVWETLFIGGMLTFLGFAIGTPKSLFWMSYYFKRMIPALIRTGNFARQPDSVRGVLGQYGNFLDGVGLPLFLLFLAALIWAGYQVFKTSMNHQSEEHTQTHYLSILLLTLLALDLPIMFSYNYPTRFFLPMMPAFAILGALFTGEVYAFAKSREKRATINWVGAILSVIIIFSFARNLSVILLFVNDARIPASKFLNTLPLGTSLEYTYYPPAIPSARFEREHNYPIHFIKVAGDVLPVNKKFDFNVGEAGLDDRLTDYLVIDSFTADKLHDPYTCQTMQVECDFFRQLETGQSNHYRLLSEFSYTLPPYLPQIRVAFVNPGIRIYERVP